VIEIRFEKPLTLDPIALLQDSDEENAETSQAWDLHVWLNKSTHTITEWWVLLATLFVGDVMASDLLNLLLYQRNNGISMWCISSIGIALMFQWQLGADVRCLAQESHERPSLARFASAEELATAAPRHPY